MAIWTNGGVVKEGEGRASGCLGAWYVLWRRCWGAGLRTMNTNMAGEVKRTDHTVGWRIGRLTAGKTNDKHNDIKHAVKK